MADLEGVQGVCSNPPLDPNYFIFMGNFKKVCGKLCKRTPPFSTFEPPLQTSWIRPWFLNRYFLYKNLMKGRYIVHRKNEISRYFTMIAQNQYKMTQMTYPRQNRQDEIFFFKTYPFFMIMDYLPCQCKSLFKIHFGH